ncbi:hypothetical protein GJR96_07240 [Haloferax sp. MBLA0076]|uniref:DUF1102 domain-containing protein n=1 Tax=Haloferax litoreum TaxID=2666140 RepID=A0A6A8GFP8_9EURY|nr:MULTISPECIES: hypothetical protein [Haloferax]KAB1193250.1 hypothetical protein Hfx1148_07235 [Haloferax sp. CBA1148]MRX21749.1 hypothetical protein [Haloferax litoreum]
MKRRNVLTAVGTLAFGVGTALGTGAVDVVSNNSDGSFRVVSPGADIRIDPADSLGATVEKNQSIDFATLQPNDLPVATVSGNGGQMVTVQVAVSATRDHDFGDILKLTNNNTDGTDYDVGFTYTGFGADVDDGSIPKSDVVEAFQFTHGSPESIVSSDWADPQYDPQNYVSVSAGTSETVGLKVVQKTSIANSVSGSFAGDSENTVLVDEVTAVANQQ